MKSYQKTLSLVLLMLMCDVAAEQKTALKTEQSAAADNTEPLIEVVEVLGRRPDGIKLSSEKILSVAGSGGDPLRALEALPGVTLATPATGGAVAKPAVRGSSPMDNQYQSDFLPVGYAFHNDGLSTFNPLLIHSFSLYSGAWAPEYNDATGAVIVTELRDPSFEHSGWFLDAGAIRSSLLYEGQINNNAAFYLSLRQSFVHLYIDNFIEDEEFDFSVPPRNNDFQSKIVWDINPQHQLRLIATAANDKVRRRFDEGSRDVAKNPDLASGEGYRSRYQQLGAVWDSQHQLGDSKVALNYLQNSQNIEEGQAWNLFAETDELLLKKSTVTEVADHELHWGFETKQQKISWLASGRAQPCQAELESCPPGLYAPLRTEQAKVQVQFVSAHLNWQQQLAANWQLDAGLAFDHNDFSDEFFTEPRLALRFDAAPGWQLSLSAGQHHQWFRRTELLSAVFGNPDLQLETARHSAFGLSQRLSPLWSWQLQFYTKTLDDLVVSNPVRQAEAFTVKNLAVSGSSTALTAQPPAFLNAGSGKASGAELLLNRDLADGWYGWFSLAYASTKRHNHLTGQAFNYEWDLPWIANLVASYQWSDNWQLGLKWRYQSGRRYTEILGATPVFHSNNGPQAGQTPLFYDPIEGELNAARRNALHRLDVRLDYRTRWGQYPVTLYAEVLNLYGSKTVQEQEWNADYSSYEEDHEFPDFPFPGLGITVQF